VACAVMPKGAEPAPPKAKSEAGPTPASAPGKKPTIEKLPG
jgi:hypothetical protein